MSHEIQSAVFSMQEGAGWTGLGLAIDQAISKEPRKIAELLDALWTVQSKPVFYQTESGSFKQVNDAAVQVRSDTGEALSVTSATRYHVNNRQPVDILEAFRDELERERLSISHAAVLRGGKVIAVSALMNPDSDIKVNGKDLLKSYVTLSTGYDLQNGTKATKGTIRVVCNNTLNFSLDEAKRTGQIKTVRASTKLQEHTLKDLVGNIQTIIEAEKACYDSLANRKMSDADVAKYFSDVLEINIKDLGKVDVNGKALISTKSQNMLEALATAYRNAPGAVGASGNMWGCLNAVTYYATHEKTVRDTCNDGNLVARVASNIMGDSAKLKQRALNLAQLAVAA